MRLGGLKIEHSTARFFDIKVRNLNQMYLLSRDRRVVALALATTLAVGVEAGSISFLTTFLVELRGFTQITSNIGLIVFLVGLAALEARHNDNIAV